MDEGKEEKEGEGKQLRHAILRKKDFSESEEEEGEPKLFFFLLLVGVSKVKVVGNRGVGEGGHFKKPEEWAWKKTRWGELLEEIPTTFVHPFKPRGGL